MKSSFLSLITFAFLQAPACAYRAGKTLRDPQGQDGAWRERQRQRYKHDWVVYAKMPLGGPAQVLEYLSRYTHRTAISNERIRHYGVLASACKGVKLDAARLALQMPAITPQAMESARAFMARIAHINVLLCPCCKVGTLHVIAALPGPTQLPGPGNTVLAQSRGPP